MCRRHGRRPVRQPLPVYLRDRTADQEDVRGLEDDAAAKMRRGLSAHDLHFVGVVMEDTIVPLEVHPAQRAGHGLREPVRDRVRVTDALALDDLRRLAFDGRVLPRFDDNVPRHGLPSAVRRRRGWRAY